MTAAPDYAELVRRLRDAAPAYRADERDEAADAIESLAARVAELEAKDMRFSQREPTAMRARSAPPELDWADLIAREHHLSAECISDLAAMLRERFGECVAALEFFARAEDTLIGNAARRALASLRGEKEKQA